MFKIKSRSKKQKALLQLGWEFIKLQIAGNIPFWGTYLIFAALDKLFMANYYQALLVATVASYTLFFVVDDRWVFSSVRKKRRTSTEVFRFIVFMSFTALLTFNITLQLHDLFGISVYVGQFISAGISILWTFVGLKFWVFSTPRRHKHSPSKRLSRTT
ncbi:MAG: GtrA family protein [Candidatus Nomurabacteria bacterium]|nr:MAG: GtrA family protein [Candidatus Nomurabacteria bacterium]